MEKQTLFLTFYHSIHNSNPLSLHFELFDYSERFSQMIRRFVGLRQRLFNSLNLYQNRYEYAGFLSPLILRAYHERVIDHYKNPRNVGSLPKDDPTVGTGLVGAPACGDVMKLQIRVNKQG